MIEHDTWELTWSYFDCIPKTEIIRTAKNSNTPEQIVENYAKRFPDRFPTKLTKVMWTPSLSEGTEKVIT